MAHYGYSFRIERLAFEASLGLYPEERMKRQPVALEVRVYYPAAPGGFTADDAAVVDYHALSDRLVALATEKHYNLIEYLAGELFRSARLYLDDQGARDAALWLKLTKCAPQVEYLEQGASFIASDLPAGATVVP